MGKRGPPPRPPRAKALEGTWRADRDPQGRSGPPPAAAPSEPLQGAPPCPPDLGEDARRIWNEVAPELVRVGVLEKCDVGILRGYCELRSRAQSLDAIAAATPSVTGRDGIPRANPCGIEARKLHKLVEKLAMDLGLVYASRARAGAPTPAQDDAARRRIEEAERFLFAPRAFTIVKGGKSS